MSMWIRVPCIGPWGFIWRQRARTADRRRLWRLSAAARISGLPVKMPEQKVWLNGEDVTESIRTEKAGMLASSTSAFSAVRKKLTQLQKELARTQDVVMDGRDIGTSVLPDAPLKIYLTASVATRARRRFLELEEKGQAADLNEIEEDIRRRDEQDMTRKLSPLRQAEDAVMVDSSQMTAEEVVERILELKKEREA